MVSFVDNFLQQLIATSLWEWLAVVLSVGYLLLAVKENIWCWPAAFISTAIYSVLFFDVNLYMESALNAYYLIMAVYGWYQWHYKTEGEVIKPVHQWQLQTHGLLIALVGILVFVSGYWLEKNTNQDYAYIDSLTTWFAVVTTYMVAKKVVENWLYWIVIDIVSIYLYLQKGFALTAVLFVFYVIIAIFGWFKWRQHYRAQKNDSSTKELPKYKKTIQY